MGWFGLRTTIVAKAVFAAALFGAWTACTDTDLQRIEPVPTFLDDKVAISGSICTRSPESRVFPLRVLFVVDTSESMRVTDPPDPITGTTRREDVVRQVWTDLLAQGIEDVRIGILRFSAEAQSRTPVDLDNDNVTDTWFTTDPVQLDIATAALSATDRVTNYASALAEAQFEIRNELSRADLESLPLSKYVVVFISDGIPDVDPTDSQGNGADQIITAVEQLKELAAIFRVGDFAMHTVYLSAGQGPALDKPAQDLLQQMAKAGGGTYRSVPNGEAVNFIDVDFSVIRRVFTLKSLAAVNLMTDVDAAQNALLTARSDDLELMLTPEQVNLAYVDADADGYLGCGEPLVDSDGDGLADMVEGLIGTSPFLPDNDDDRLSERRECDLAPSRDPLDPTDSGCYVASRYAPDAVDPELCACLVDTDIDGVCDCAAPGSTVACADPDNGRDRVDADLDGRCDCPDLDEDGFCDYVDRDGDRLVDCEEVYVGSARNGVDSDADGLPDLMEARDRTSPVDVDVNGDYDFDRTVNGQEVRGGTDPLCNDAGLRSRLAYRYDLETTGIDVDRTCYTFTIGNITLAPTLANPSADLYPPPPDEDTTDAPPDPIADAGDGDADAGDAEVVVPPIESPLGRMGDGKNRILVFRRRGRLRRPGRLRQLPRGVRRAALPAAGQLQEPAVGAVHRRGRLRRPPRVRPAARLQEALVKAPPTLMLALALAATAACGSDSTAKPDAVDDTGVPCQRDDVDEPAGAVPLPTTGATGYICPVGDTDWYSFTTGPDDHLLRIQLSMDGDLSPIEPAYIVWTVGPDGAPAAVAAAAPPERLGFDLDETACVAPGSYLVAVRDDGEDAQDFRRQYTLTMSSAPDPDSAEPNDSAAGAASISESAPATGAIACTGDTDWYGFDVGPGQLVSLHLTMPIATLQPTLRLIKDDGQQGTLLATQQNLSGSVRATDLTLQTVLPDSGRYFAVVTDDDGKSSDPAVTYTLTLKLEDDSDPNEPNGHPDTATPLSGAAIPCGGAWSGWLEQTGNIGAPGDNDWFRLPLSNCGPQGLIEAEVVMQDQGLGNAARWELASKVQLALTVVREHSASPCSADLSCQALTRTCENDYDCSGLFNTCLPDGFCAGAGVCLPEGDCGANVVQHRFEPPAAPANPATVAPPPHKATVTAPLFGDDLVYLRVADFQSDAGDPTVSYKLRARVRTEPDQNEPSNVYAPTLLADFPVPIQAAASKPIPVHDCTTSAEHPTADCCGADTWIEGELSYENDLDFYRYDHPCAGEDCNLRIVYQFDGGPVDFVLSVYEGDSLWFGGVAGASAEAASQPAINGAYGGANACFYAYSGHEGDPFHYYVGIRDLADVRDWSADQHYRFCVERTSRSCASPCKLYENGCGQP
ncbi:MAG: vWA domain-containing protein [Myxococcota bacterium]